MKTAVEWLEAEIDNKDMGEIPMWIYNFCQQAKELEKKQLRQCYHFAQIEQQKEFSSIYVGMSFEKWYNEIYKNE